MFRKFLQVVERRGPSRRAITALLEGGARDKAFWTDRELVDGLGAAIWRQAPHVAKRRPWTTPEHQALAVMMTDRAVGYAKHHRLDLDFVTTGEFRTLAAAYTDVRELMMGPVIIRTVTSASAAAEQAADAADEAELATERAAVEEEAERAGVAAHVPASPNPTRTATPVSRPSTNWWSTSCWPADAAWQSTDTRVWVK